MILGAVSLLDVYNWLECTMDTDANMTDHMSSDEMYMMLQADMVNIKAQEQDLQKEIGSIKTKFVHLLKTCGLENEFPLDEDVKMTTPRRPTHDQQTPRRNNTNYNYADFLIEQLLAGSNTLTDSDLSISPEDTRNSAEVEPEILQNAEPCNPLSADAVSVPQQNYFHMDTHTMQPTVNRMPNNIDVTTSENGVVTSDSYPQSSSDSSDNQVVPDLDLEKELVSRVQYYSDFTIDRQRKINQFLNNLKQNSTVISHPEVAPVDDITTREVEGAEQKSFKKVYIAQTTRRSSISSSAAGSSTTSSGSSRHRRNKTSSSRTSSHPLMSSTMISDPSNVLPSSSSSNSSVYTWSIDENSDPADLEGSYLRSRRRSSHGKHRVHKSSSSSHRRTSSMRRSSRHSRREAPSLHLTHMVSTIEESTCSRHVFAENSIRGTLPRTSTKAQLPIINNSSWEKNPIHSTSGAEFFSIQPSDCDDTVDTSPLQERLALPGKSSSSGSSGAQTQNLYNTRVTALTQQSSLSNSSSLLDTVLTDSPADSVNSSGIFAPCNSPRNYSSVGSHCGYTTVSSSIPSSSSNDYANPAPTPAFVKASDPIFKIPHSPIGKKRSSRKSASHSPSVRTSTPRPPYSVGSTHSEPVMRRKLFSLSPSAGAGTEHKILDKKALVRKFKKFSHHFYKSEKSNKIKTLAQL